MKNTMIKRLSGLTLAALLLVAGCDFQAAEDAFDGFDIIIELEEINTSVSVRFVDSDTDAFLSSEVTARFLGDNGADVIDIYSDPMPETTFNGGIGAFGVKNSLTPSESNPVIVRLVASANGYETSSQTIQIEEVGLTEATLFMSRSNQTVQGGASASGSGQATSGTVSQPVQATTSGGDATNQATAAVSVPVGTQATTSTGQSASGTLQTNVSFYTAPTTQTAQAFPGGFSGGIQQQSGAVTNQPITTAGFMTVSVTDGSGNEITNFNPAIELSIDVPGTTINPTTGAPVQNGGTITIMSFNETSGVWVNEGNAILDGPNANGNFKATFLTNHLSTWSAGYVDTGCTVPVTVNRNNNTGSFGIQASARNTSGALIWSGNSTLAAGNSTKNINDFPTSAASISVIVDGITATATNPCSNGVTVSLPAPAPSKIDVRFSLDFGNDCPALRTTTISNYVVIGKPLKLDCRRSPSRFATAT